MEKRRKGRAKRWVLQRLRVQARASSAWQYRHTMACGVRPPTMVEGRAPAMQVMWMSGGNRHVGRRRVEPLHAAGGRHAHQTVAWRLSIYPLDSPPSGRLLPSRRPLTGVLRLGHHAAPLIRNGPSLLQHRPRAEHPNLTATPGYSAYRTSTNMVEKRGNHHYGRYLIAKENSNDR